MGEDAAHFKNSSPLTYNGDFVVELSEHASTDIVPKTAVIEGRKVTVAAGRIEEDRNRIHLYAPGVPESFSWGSEFIRTIHDGQGNLLWMSPRVQTAYARRA